MTKTPIPVVFIHGLWLHATSWTPWLEIFREAGYDPVAPGWPNEPATVEEAREQPDLVANAGIDDVAAHYTKIVDSLDASPILVGHSFGGLIAEKLLGQGVGVAGVAIDPAQIKGVLPLPLAQLRAALPALSNPTNLRKSVSLTQKEFRFGFGNAPQRVHPTSCSKNGRSLPRPGPCFRRPQLTSRSTHRRRSTRRTRRVVRFCSSLGPRTIRSRMWLHAPRSSSIVTPPQ